MPITTSSLTAPPVFQASGLASGMDTQGIIDGLMAIENKRVERIQQKQLDYTTQLSSLTDLIIKGQSLRQAAESLQNNGIDIGPTSTNTNFSASATGSVNSGTYNVQVTNLAQTAKGLSGGFTSSATTIIGGELTINVKGTDYVVNISDGSTLSKVAQTINDSSAPVSAAVLFDGTDYHLSITNNETGHTIGEPASSGLSLSMNETGSTGTTLNVAGFTMTDAENATFVIDGLAFERTGNTVTDAIPNVALELTGETAAVETLTFGPDADSSYTRLKTFVDAYNSIMSALRAQINVVPGTDTSPMLTRDSEVRQMFRVLDDFTGMSITGAGDYKYLTDLGVNRDLNGNLSIDSAKFKAAVKSNPTDLEAFFTDETHGFGTRTADILKRYTDSVSGSLFQRQDDITSQITDLDEKASNVQDQINRMRERMVRQFTYMEKITSQMNSLSDFLSSQEKRDTKST